MNINDEWLLQGLKVIMTVMIIMMVGGGIYSIYMLVRILFVDDKTCKNCKYWDNYMLDEIDDSENCYKCIDQIVIHYTSSDSGFDSYFEPQGNFGCNQWEPK